MPTSWATDCSSGTSNLQKKGLGGALNLPHIGSRIRGLRTHGAGHVGLYGIQVVPVFEGASGTETSKMAGRRIASRPVAFAVKQLK